MPRTSLLTVTLSLLLAYCGLATAPARAEFLFDGPALASFPEPSSSAVLGDFNEDGLPDVAGAMWNGLAVTLNRGGGAFGPAESYVAPRTRRVAVGDTDNDGHLDLVVSGPGSFTVFLGDGDGRFAALDTNVISTAEAPWSVWMLETADFDGDGNLDLLRTPGELGRLLVWPGRGDGTFGAPYPVPADHEIVTLEATDWNEDGLDDVVKVTRSDWNRIHVSVAVSDGRRGFHRTRSIACESSRAPVLTTGDIDGDGSRDLLLTSGGYFDSVLRVFGRSGERGLIEKVSIPLEGLGYGMFTIPSAGTPGPDSVFVAALTLEEPMRLWRLDAIATGNAVRREGFDIARSGELQAVDMDGDGRRDLVITPNPGWAGHGAVVYRGTESGFATEQIFRDLNSRHTFAYDVDRDGDLDLVSVLQDMSPPYPSVQVLANDGTGRLARPVDSLGWTRHVRETPVIADLDGDGADDLAFSVNRGGLRQVAVRWADRLPGTGAFEVFPTENSIRPRYAGDFNGDGQMDLVGFDTWMTLLLGAGDGQLVESYVRPAPGALTARIDLQSNGTDDLLLAFDDRLFYWAGHPVRPLYAGGYAPQTSEGEVHTGFLNDDAYPDFVVDREDDTVLMYRSTDGNTARGGQKVFVPGKRESRLVAVADLDGNGRHELLFSGKYGASRLLVVETNPDGSFGASFELYGTDSYGRISVADLDDDGRDEIVIADGRREVRVIRNRSSASP